MARPIKPEEHLQWIVGAAILVGALLSFLPSGAGAIDEQPLKIEFTHGSSVNPRHFERWQCKLDTRSMKAEEVSQLTKLVNTSNILNSKDSEYSSTEGGPFFTIEIEKAKQKRKFNWSYEHAPGSIQPLVRFLKEHSKKTVFEMGKEVK